MASDQHPHDRSSSSTREGWLRDFAVLLRLRGVEGARIGEELATVEAHCDDAGQEPKEAFGEPASYIATLELGPTRSLGRLVRVFLPILALVIGANFAAAATLHWSGAEAFTAVAVSTLFIIVAFAVVLVRS